MQALKHKDIPKEKDGSGFKDRALSEGELKARLDRLVEIADAFSGVRLNKPLHFKVGSKIKESVDVFRARKLANAVDVAEFECSILTVVAQEIRKNLSDCSDWSVSRMKLYVLGISDAARATDTMDLLSEALGEVWNLNVKGGFRSRLERIPIEAAGMKSAFGSDPVPAREYYGDYCFFIEASLVLKSLAGLMPAPGREEVVAIYEDMKSNFIARELEILEPMSADARELLAASQRYDEEVRKYWPGVQPPDPYSHANELTELDHKTQKIEGIRKTVLPRLKEFKETMSDIMTNLLRCIGGEDGFKAVEFDETVFLLFGPIDGIARDLNQASFLRNSTSDIFRLHKMHFGKYFQE
ncbi:MAG: hypothetical protein U0R44_00380 [Candidatus Micrarchaeia archaeon]